jgi:hypothetical protein
MNRRNLLRLALTSPLTLLPLPDSRNAEADKAQTFWDAILTVIKRTPLPDYSYFDDIHGQRVWHNEIHLHTSQRSQAVFSCYHLIEEARLEVCPDYILVFNSDFDFETKYWHISGLHSYRHLL